MTKMFKYAASAFLCLFFIQVKAQKISLKINAEPSVNKKVTVTTPVLGSFFSAAGKEYTLNEANSLTTVLPSPGIGIIRIEKDFYQVNLIASGSNENYTLDFEGEKKGWLIKGTNATGQMLFNKLFYDNTRTRYAELDKFPTATARVNEVARLKQNDLSQFKTLLDKKEINLAFYNEIEKQADVYYRLLLSTDLFFISRGYSKPKVEFDATHLAAYKETVSVITQPYVKRSVLYEVFLSRYISSLELQAKADGKDIALDREKYGANYSLWHIDLLKPVLKQADLEHPWATLIASGIGVNQNEKEWPTNFEDFKKTYPRSKYIPVLTPLVKRVADYQLNLAQGNADIKFLSDTEQINTLEELGQAVKGKVTYIDLWATWCGPCREELQYSIKLHHQFEEIGVQPLYLSTDVKSADAAWRTMLKGLGLKGMHIRTSDALRKDLNKVVPNFNGIPRYLILNKEGKVVNWDAQRPSSGSLLIEQLKNVQN